MSNISRPQTVTTLALVEPWSSNHLPDRPHLGCAMLLGACRSRNISAQLVAGPSRWLRDLFLTDQAELWHLMHDLPADIINESPWVKKLRDQALDIGEDSFAHKLTGMYQKAVQDKDLRVYFDATAFNELSEIADIATMLYRYYIRVQKHENLHLIHRYVRLIGETNPSYVGFSIGKDLDVVSQTIIRKTRELTGVPVLLGGSSTPFFDEKRFQKVLLTPLADYVVVGMGEETLPDLIELLEAGKSPEALSGVYYLQQGAITGHPPTKQPLMDNLPLPDFSQFDLQQYFTPKLVLPLQTARGCSWRRCSFCTHFKIYENEYDMLHIDKLIDLIEELKSRYGCSHFAFHDEELPPARARRMSEQLIERGVTDVFLYGYARMLKAFDDEVLLGAMYRAGFRTICWGIESASQKVVSAMQKGTHVEDMDGILQKSAQLGFCNLCFVMFGFPGEEEVDAMETLNFIKRHAADIEELLMSTFSLEPGTPIAANPEKWNITIDKNGSWSCAQGMTHSEATMFMNRVKGEIDLGILRLGSLSLKTGQNFRMQHFLRVSHNPLTTVQIAATLEKSDVQNLFPLVLGKLSDNSHTPVLELMNTTSTTILNSVRKPNEMPLSDIELRFFQESQGKKSMQDIIDIVARETNQDKLVVHELALQFFRTVFIDNLGGLMFGKSWE